jgi:Domain of unknown function (DUF5680)
MVSLADLEAFVVRAKGSTYVGSGSTAESSRLGSHDLAFQSDEWLYRDSYFGGTDFLGQETVWFRAEPVWAENYYGYILRPDLIDAARAGARRSRKPCRRCITRGAFWAALTGLARTGTIKIIRRATSRTSLGAR